MSEHSQGPFGLEAIINCILINDRFGDRCAVLPAQTDAHDLEEQLANARLFKLAPTLFSEVKTMLAAFDPKGVDPALNTVRAAVAEVEGVLCPSMRVAPPAAHRGRSL